MKSLALLTIFCLSLGLWGPANDLDAQQYEELSQPIKDIDYDRPSKDSPIERDCSKIQDENEEEECYIDQIEIIHRQKMALLKKMQFQTSNMDAKLGDLMTEK